MIDKIVLEALLESLGQSLDEETHNYLLVEFEETSNTYEAMDCELFIRLMAWKIIDFEDEQYEGTFIEAFKAFDKDGSGRISEVDFRRELDKCEIYLGPMEYTLRSRASKNPDGTINYRDY